VKANGHLQLKTQQWLYFGTSGAIKEVLVKEGDRVTAGQVLARLDETDLRAAVSHAENALLQQQLAVSQAEKAEQSARLDFERTAERLSEAIPSSDVVFTWYSRVPAIRADIAQAQDRLTAALAAGAKPEDISSRLEEIKALLASAYEASLTTEYVPVSKQETVAQTTATLRQLQYEVEKTKLAVTVSGGTVLQSRNLLEAARLNLDTARRELSRTVLAAPFDGVIADVPARAGDRLSVATYTVTPVVLVADPATMEMEGYLDELDRAGVVPGAAATVTVDALPGVPVKGTLTFLSPVARIQSGVVSYAFTISLAKPYPAGLADGMSATAALAGTNR
jgi:multidrug resistance efflux pump